MGSSLPLISWGALTGQVPVITVGMAAQEWEKKQEFIQCRTSMDCQLQALFASDWVVPITGTAMKVLLFLKLPQFGY